MFAFDPQHPFPYWPDYGPALYSAAKEHAAQVDAWLGIPVGEIEATLLDPKDTEERWIGRPPEIFLTPYVELRHWLERVRPEGTVVDLGAGYGRLGFVMARHWPEARFLGFELVENRVRAGTEAFQRFGARSATLVQANIAALQWELPTASTYFIYDFGSRSSIERILEKFRLKAKLNGIQVVGRGRAIRDHIEREHPWLSSVHPPIHGTHYSIYRSF
jgi:hypothetical protein